MNLYYSRLTLVRMRITLRTKVDGHDFARWLFLGIFVEFFTLRLGGL